MIKTFYIGKSYGSSMKPLINEGDKLYIQKAKIAELKIGEVIVFYNEKKLISHRVIKKTNKFVVTKGDNNLFIDPPISNKHILGRIMRISGKYGDLDFTTLKARFIQYYFLFRSLIIYYIPRIIGKVLSKLLVGRQILTRLMD